MLLISALRSGAAVVLGRWGRAGAASTYCQVFRLCRSEQCTRRRTQRISGPAWSLPKAG